MRKYKLTEIIKKHEKWLHREKGGKQACLRGADLHGIDLSSVDLRFADLRNTNLQYAKLQYADLREANLKEANLQWVKLQLTNLQEADLRLADLSYANLEHVKLQGAALYNANLRKVTYPWLFYVGNIGSRDAETIYLADIDNVRCGCWNAYKGGTLSEFKARVDETYPENGIINQMYRLEYLSVIRLFESMRKAYLKQK